MQLFGKIIIFFEDKINKAKSKYYASLYNGNGYIDGTNKIQYPNNIYIGTGSIINGGGSIIASPNAKIVIGENCMISYGVHLRTSYHNYMDRSVPMKLQGMQEANIMIGNDVWIGYGAQIMSGVSIGDGAVIGAGAVVCKDCEPYSVNVGVPARRIKYRG